MLLDAMKVETWHNLTKFLVLSGCRIGEVLALNEDDIDLINREITISKTYDSNNRVVYDLISRRLGHEDSKITRDIYIHITEKRKEKDNELIKNVHLV